MPFYNDGKKTYDSNPNERLTQNPAEQVAAKMYGVADRINVEDAPKWHERYTQIGTEFASGNFDKGQRLLETDGVWDDEIRGIATQANLADLERIGEKSFGFSDAKGALDKYAKGLAEVGEDERGAMAVDSISRGMDRPGLAGIDGIDEALKYIEGTLQAKATSENTLTLERKKDWQEKRGVRDALYAEKQRRMEEMKQLQNAEKKATMDRQESARHLENLYTEAGIPEDVPSRQELMGRVGKMSESELQFLGIELKRVAAEFGRSRDKKELDARLSDLVHRKFTREELSQRNEIQRQRDLTTVKGELGMAIDEGNAESISDSDNESPEARFKKFQNYEAHQRSAQSSVRSLQEARNFESKNNTESALSLFESALANMTQRASDEDIQKLRGVSFDLAKEKEQFGIDDGAVADYERLRKMQNELANGKTVKEVADMLEEELGEEYGISKIDLEGIETMKDLNASGIGVKLSAEATDDPNLVGRIKEVKGTGYHIPNVPVYNMDKTKVVNTVNRDIKAGPSVVAYRAK